LPPDKKFRTPLKLSSVVHRDAIDHLVQPSPRILGRVKLVDRYYEGVLHYVDGIVPW
jgi:hypothetical protein